MDWHSGKALHSEDHCEADHTSDEMKECALDELLLQDGGPRTGTGSWSKLLSFCVAVHSIKCHDKPPGPATAERGPVKLEPHKLEMRLQNALTQTLAADAHAACVHRHTPELMRYD